MNKFRYFVIAVSLIFRSGFCTVEAGLEVTYDAEGDSSVFTYILEDIIVNSYYEKISDFKDLIVTERDIQLKQPLNAADAVKSAPDINASTGTKGETNTKIRGFSSEDVLILVDGKPINPGYYGKVDLSMIPSDNIAKIKILKGPASVSYGTNNTGGVVNIITKNGQEKTETKISGMFGDNEFQKMNINHSFKTSLMNYWAAGYYQHRNGYALSEDFEPTSFENGGLRNNSFYEKWGADAKVSYEPSQEDIYSLSLGYHSAEKEVPYSIYTFVPQRYFVFPEWYRYQASISGYKMLNKKTDLKGIITFDSYQDRLLSYKNAEFSDGELDYDSWLKNYTLGTIWSGSYSINSFHEISYGLSTLRYYLKKWDTGDPKLKREIQTGSIYADYLFRPDDRTDINLGVALNSLYKDNDGSFENYPGFSFTSGYETVYGIRLNAGISLTQRFPTMHELYSTTGGNEDLEAEECVKYEAGITKEHKFKDNPVKLNLEASVFYNDMNNLIEKQSAEDQYKNIDARIAGIEIGSEAGYGEILSAVIGYSYMKPYEYGNNMLYESSKQKINAGLEFAYKRIVLNYELSLYGKRETEYTRVLPSYSMHNVNITYKLNVYTELLLKAENISDTDYEEEVGFPAPGRLVTGGFTITF
ncbi:MAG TPA: TonB-dependent receptor plug domain-containing protein [Clostridiales bacterium]|nr:TonB-dependent receptor plug domain-containing protein [Clostridiales bacterium]HQP69165.1 TonB-dependent receptor plug domain-containing protein [Clostridiales bacterium]